MQPISEINRPNIPSYVSKPNQVSHRFHKFLPINLICHTSMLLGALTSSWPAKKWVDDEKTKKKTEKNIRWPTICSIFSRRRRPVACGIALDRLRWAMRSVTYWRTDRASVMSNKYGTFLSFFLAFKPAFCPGQYSQNTCLMAAFSGFAWSPEPPLLFNIGSVAPAHQFERQNRSDGHSLDLSACLVVRQRG